MGLLSNGTPMEWSEAQKYANHVRQQGITQLINIYKRLRTTRQNDKLLWGDELEYMVVRLDPQNHTSALCLRAADVLAQLQAKELKREIESSWKPEYARYMLEGTPLQPYSGEIDSVAQVEANMLARRREVVTLLQPGEHLMLLTNFPLLGAGQFLFPHAPPRPLSSANGSHLVPDDAIAPHARFPTLTRNIRARRGCKVCINVPVFRDVNTVTPYQELFEEAKNECIYLDCMCFGMGMSCLQVTFQSADIDEARHMFDQMATLTPILLALTAGTPIFKGMLADVDCRWNIISGSVDDRTDAERGLVDLPAGARRIRKSRYDSISTYIGRDFDSAVNDLPFAFDEKIMQRLQSEGDMDARLAKHFAHLFIRDPLVIFRELLNVDNTVSTDHFENLQSTNWQTMRFKPPPPATDIGWRVEFRSMELHLTEFENAAYACFVMLLYRAIKYFQLDLYMPLSLVDVNMQVAQKRNAVLDLTFHFRREIEPSGSADTSTVLMTIDELMNGSATFKGFIPIVRDYLTAHEHKPDTDKLINSYLQLISMRACGKKMTTAAYIRKLVMQHPQYRHDSVVSQQVAYDLLCHLRDIGDGVMRPTELLPPTM